jgi:hypothetical protein
MDQTSAERQTRYREKQRREKVDRQLYTWIDADAFNALSAVAKKNGMTKKVVLERLILKYWDDMVFAAELASHIKKPTSLKGKKGVYK